MKIKTMFALCIALLTAVSAHAEPPRVTMSLNGIWEFDQTVLSVQPTKFRRSIPVPGLVHLARPRIEEYDKFFKIPNKAIDGGAGRMLVAEDYTPRYSWYRKKIRIGNELKDKGAVLTIKKSQYVTQVIVNGIDLGTYVECYTPIDVLISKALKYGQENEILLRVGDRYWLPDHAAGSTDKEKEHYLPGIWDDVLISFTNNVRVNRLLALPSLKDKKVTVKAKLWNLQRFDRPNARRVDQIPFQVKVYEKKTRKLAGTAEGMASVLREQQGEISIEVPVTKPHPWSPDDPFLYTVELSLGKAGEFDQLEKSFGMRDFERRGKSFYLNNEKIFLRGSNITLQRFFEDPECGNLAWDTVWVKKLLIDMPKELKWNAMRICVGIVPDFWYDLADEHGMVFQNEWLYWQVHGWNDQVKKEYTDWVWNDGSHPSIVIWDAINENWNDYIGNILIPELRQLDPTRIWDAGYMTATHMSDDAMDEPHTYQGRGKDGIDKVPYPLGNLKFRPQIIKELEESSAAQLVNEYGWVWLWRDGTPSKLTTPIYKYYLGEDKTADQRREFQAYWLQCETEWLRANRSIAGLLAFCHLTNNYGYTGDWFVGNIKDLQPGPSLQWFKHCFAPTTVFLDLTDERYAKGRPVHEPGSYISFSLAGINDVPREKKGSVTLSLLNSKGARVFSETKPVDLPASDRVEIPYAFSLPTVADGYLLISEFTESGQKEKLISRRYIKVGKQDQYNFYDMPVANAFSK